MIERICTVSLDRIIQATSCESIQMGCWDARQTAAPRRGGWSSTQRRRHLRTEWIWWKLLFRHRVQNPYNCPIRETHSRHHFFARVALERPVTRLPAARLVCALLHFGCSNYYGRATKRTNGETKMQKLAADHETKMQDLGFKYNKLQSEKKSFNEHNYGGG